MFIHFYSLLRQDNRRRHYVTLLLLHCDVIIAQKSIIALDMREKEFETEHGGVVLREPHVFDLYENLW